MGDLGDMWREHRAYKRTPQSWQYRCECGLHVPKRKLACSYCQRPNPEPEKRKRAKPGRRPAT